MKNFDLNEYEAALAFDMSPTLLRWFTSYEIFDKTKLSFKLENEIYYYDREELISFNKKMEGKWPKTGDGKRPRVPEGIKREIKQEARSACPVCNKSYGEIAHIDAVAATHCNHPKNLIFLCPDHHTEYDNTKIPSNIDRNEVITLKKGLKIFQRQLWKIQGNTIDSYLNALNSAKSLLKVHEIIRNIIPESEFKSTLNDITKSVGDLSGKKIVPDELSNSSFIEDEIEKYISTHNENLCPLCSGLGATSFYDPCPVCLGNGEVKKGMRDTIDLSQFELVNCKLCDGSGKYNGEDCPACNCAGKVSQHFYDYHDWSMYDLVDCKLCSGSGRYNGEDCPVCNCTGQVFQHVYDNHNWSMYDLMDCKLCSGSGRYNGEDCPVCNCTGQVSQHVYDNHDWSMYDLVDCKLCNGSGRYNGEDCPTCDCTGKVTQLFYDNHDWGQSR
ncbi:hypothetical protein KAM461_42330 [Aeromonas hydrophila]|nr:hypothetical protein KAM461_42330 [Aeromonas hydrophila]